MTQENQNLPEKQSNVGSAGKSVVGRVFLIMFGILTVIFVGLSSIVKWESACVTPLFILYVALIVATISAVNKQKTAEEKASVKASTLRQAREEYEALKNQVSIPESAKEIAYFKCSAKSPIELANQKQKVYIWKSDENIFFFPCVPETVDSISFATLKINSIPISQIEYFSKRGEVFRENKISGGGGGGSSIGGAIAGGLVAGEAGAVIGSRKKINEIKSELITHDTRETFVNYFANNEKHSLFFDIYAFQIFNDLIPEKEFSIVNTIKSSEIIKNQVNTKSQKSVTDQLRELAKLRDDGIITENEFNEKKKQLLDKIS